MILFRSIGAATLLFVAGTFHPVLAAEDRAIPLEGVLNTRDLGGLTTQDGRTHLGTVSAENERQVTLRVVGRDPVVINKSDIQSRETSPASMMPEGLLGQLSDEEVVDLIAYLMSSEQVDMPSD